MDILQIYNPDIEVYVRYRRVPYEEVELFVEDNEGVDSSSENFIRKVLKMCVPNLQSEVATALRDVDKEKAYKTLRKIYNGCIMLNPGIDVDEWLSITGDIAFIKGSIDKDADFPPTADGGEEASRDEHPSSKSAGRKKATQKRKRKPITKPKFLGLEGHLKSTIVGQDEAIEAITKSLKRSVAGLREEDRPLGVFLFAGSSGVGKSELAKQLHKYLFGDSPIVRVDFGELQQKHDVQKLLGAPPSYVGYDDGGQLTNQMKKASSTVVLLDEVEKAHPDIWNALLRVFDEGQITDNTGEAVSFKDAIIIMTTNLGNTDIASAVEGSDIGFGNNLTPSGVNPSRRGIEKYVNKAIKKYFRPELLNRIDQTVIFNHLTTDDLVEIARLEINKLGEKLSKKGISLSYSDSLIEHMVKEGFAPLEGARGMRRLRMSLLEDRLADELLYKSSLRGSVVSLAWENGELVLEFKSPEKQERKA